MDSVYFSHQPYSTLLSALLVVQLQYSNGHNGTVFRVLYPKISTGQEKLAPTGRHGRHVFATLLRGESYGSCSPFQGGADVLYISSLASANDKHRCAKY